MDKPITVTVVLRGESKREMGAILADLGHDLIIDQLAENGIAVGSSTTGRYTIETKLPPQATT